MAQDQPKLQLNGAHVLKANATSIEVLEFMLMNEKFFQGESLTDFTVGQLNNAGNAYVLPNAVTAENQRLGRRYILACVGDPNIRSLLQSEASGPDMWNVIQTQLLGGRDTQALLLESLESMRFDATTGSVISLYGRFSLFASAIRPVLPHGRKCMLYSLCFPQELHSIINACDLNPGHADFVQYATAVNRQISTQVTRLSALRRREGSSHAGLITSTASDNANGSVAHPLDAHVSPPGVNTNEQLAVLLAGLLDQAQGNDAVSAFLSGQRAPKPIICINCGQSGHKAPECKQEKAS